MPLSSTLLAERSPPALDLDDDDDADDDDDDDAGGPLADPSHAAFCLSSRLA